MKETSFESIKNLSYCLLASNEIDEEFKKQIVADLTSLYPFTVLFHAWPIHSGQFLGPKIAIILPWIYCENYQALYTFPFTFT